MATALKQAMTELGASAYRLGGDEFCVLASVPRDGARAVTAAAALALTEHGGGFHIIGAARPYAAQQTLPEAIGELRRCAGSQFDPEVVDALSELVVELVWTPERSATAGGPDPVRDRT